MLLVIQVSHVAVIKTSFCVCILQSKLTSRLRRPGKKRCQRSLPKKDLTVELILSLKRAKPMSHCVIKKLAPNQQLYPHDSVKAKLRFQAFGETRWATRSWVPRKHQATHHKAKRGVEQTTQFTEGFLVTLEMIYWLLVYKWKIRSSICYELSLYSPVGKRKRSKFYWIKAGLFLKDAWLNYHQYCSHVGWE